MWWLAVSMDKPLPRAVGLFFSHPEMIMKLWTVVTGISQVLSEKPLAQSFIDRVLWAAGKGIEPASWV